MFPGETPVGKINETWVEKRNSVLALLPDIMASKVGCFSICSNSRRWKGS